MNQAPDGVGHATDSRVPDGLDWDLWCGPAIKCPFNPILATDSYHHGSWMAYSGGWTPGMAPHIIDLPVWALELGYPTMISSAGGRYILEDDGDAYDHHEVLWQYPNLTMTWMSSLTNSYDFLMKSQPPERRLGIYFHGQRHTLFQLRHVPRPLRGRPHEGHGIAARVDPFLSGARTRMARRHQVAPTTELQCFLPSCASTCRSS
jgi:hypothetical protein